MLVDFELIRRAQKNDSAAFNEIVLAYRKRILGTITRLIARPEDVEDVAQEVFLRLYFSLDQLREEKVFEPWLYRLTVNAAFDYLRKLRRRQEFRMSDLSEQQVMLADAMAGGKADQDENFMSEVWEEIEARQTNACSFRRMASALVTAAVALSIVLGVYMSIPRTNGYSSQSYSEALADANALDGPDIVGPVHLDPV